MSGVDEGGGDLSAVVRELAGVVLGADPLEAVLDLVVSLARETLPGAKDVSVTVGDGDVLTTQHATSEDAVVLDHVQYGNGDGPCVASVREGRPQNVDIEAMTTRWPEFAEAARDRGVARVLSVPLQARGATVGALNLYAANPDAFGPEEETRARLFAHHAAVVVANAAAYASAEARTAQLLEALESRDVIGQAKGIVMVRERCSPEEAFDVLRQVSQRTHRKLRDVAQEVADAAAAERRHR